MKHRTPLIAALSLAISAAIAAPALAQESIIKAPTAAQQKQLDAARAKLDAAAQGYADLAPQYGLEPQALDILRRPLRQPGIRSVLPPDAQAGLPPPGLTPGSARAPGVPT